MGARPEEVLILMVRKFPDKGESPNLSGPLAARPFGGAPPLVADKWGQH